MPSRLAEKEIEVSQARGIHGERPIHREVKEFYMGLEDRVISKCHLDGPRGPVNNRTPQNYLPWSQDPGVSRGQAGGEGARIE